MKNKINKKVLAILIAFLISMTVVIYDLFIIATIFSSSWTILGSVTFCIACIIAELSYEYLNKKSADISYTSISTK